MVMTPWSRRIGLVKPAWRIGELYHTYREHAVQCGRSGCRGVLLHSRGDAARLRFGPCEARFVYNSPPDSAVAPSATAIARRPLSGQASSASDSLLSLNAAM